jgi:hypothetical protein
MKAGLLTIAALSAVAVAQPQHGAHKHRHNKKQAVEYATVTDTTYVTAAPEVVYVDQNGNKVNQPAATPAAQEQLPSTRLLPLPPTLPRLPLTSPRLRLPARPRSTLLRLTLPRPTLPRHLPLPPLPARVAPRVPATASLTLLTTPTSLARPATRSPRTSPLLMATA